MPLPADTPPPVGPRGLAIRCAAQGADAYAAGAPVLACPYDATRPYSRRAWVAGYSGAAARAGVVLDPDDVDDDAPFPVDA